MFSSSDRQTVYDTVWWLYVCLCSNCWRWSISAQLKCFSDISLPVVVRSISLIILLLLFWLFSVCWTWGIWWMCEEKDGLLLLKLWFCCSTFVSSPCWVQECTVQLEHTHSCFQVLFCVCVWDSLHALWGCWDFVLCRSCPDRRHRSTISLPAPPPPQS